MTYVTKYQAIRVSIVVPVYNEADRIAACLHAIARQTVQPFEVIVVDNNSRDDTVAIASQFPFVTVIHESRQGVVHARNAGFDAARGDVIGRIDADTIVSPNWMAALQRLFLDPTLDAVTGKVEYNDMAHAALMNQVDLFFRRRFARLLGREVALQGSNMGMRRSAWQTVHRFTCDERGLHEDFDLAIHLTRHGCTVRFDERLKVAIGFRQTESTWREFTRYAMISPRTYAKHGLKSQRHMYPAVFLAVAFYVPLWMLHHGYDAKTDGFSWRTLRNSSAIRRVNPATYVD